MLCKAALVSAAQSVRVLFSSSRRSTSSSIQVRKSTCKPNAASQTTFASRCILRRTCFTYLTSKNIVRCYTSNKMTSEVSAERIEEITATYKTLARTPFIEQGWVKPDLPTTVMIQYSQRDLPRNKKNRIVRSFFEGESFSFKPFPFAVNMTNVVLMEPSPSWTYLAVLRSIKEKGEEDEKYLLEIWDNGCIAAAIPTEGKHGQVYSDSFFGSLTWSSDEKCVAYIAERNAPKTASFFSSKPGAEDDKKPKPGSKFELREDWGETYKGGNPVIVVASVEKEAVAVVPGVPENLSAGQVQWAPRNKNLVFTGWSTEPRRLGIVHCYNRPCAIYAVPIDIEALFTTSSASSSASNTKDKSATSRSDASTSAATASSTSSSSSNRAGSPAPEENKTVKITLDNICSRSPRFSRDGKLLVYLAAENTKTHNSASKLLTLDWIGGLDSSSPTDSASSSAPSSTRNSDARSRLVSGEEKVIIDIVNKCSESEADFPGLFMANLPARCFIEDRKIIFSSQWRSYVVPLLVDLQTKEMRKVTVPGCSTSNLNVQDVRQDVCALFDGSELNRVPFNFVGRWDHNKAAFRDWKVTPHPPSITTDAISVSELSWECEVAPLAADDKYNAKCAPGDPHYVSGIEYLLTLPSNFGEDEAVKTPIILFPHGGPHAANAPTFLLSPAFFASIGYAVLFVNYRGSLGFGKNFVDALPGNVGDMDVSDCLLALKHVLAKHKSIDNKRVYVMGGSHGGFLTGHLLATPSPASEQKWSAGVMINAVTNMAHCVGISDIPDWCYVESASTDLKTGLSKMFDMSPIAKIGSVKAPTLIVLGAADKRVPISQSVEYYHALRAQGTETRMLKYPGAGHGIVEPEQEADYLINTALWFEQHK